MKKLVTIVSAVMMLLMLAACAPTYSENAEQAAAIEDATTAYNILAAYAQTLTDKTEFTLEEDADVSYLNYTDVVIKSGATYSDKTEGTDTKTRTVSFEATVSWTVPAEYETVDGKPSSIVKTPAVDKEVTVSFTGSKTVTTGENAGTSLKLGPWTINGVNYEPAKMAAIFN